MLTHSTRLVELYVCGGGFLVLIRSTSLVELYEGGGRFFVLTHSTRLVYSRDVQGGGKKGVLVLTHYTKLVGEGRGGEPQEV